jgi:hypothetical protein
LRQFIFPREAGTGFERNPFSTFPIFSLHSDADCQIAAGKLFWRGVNRFFLGNVESFRKQIDRHDLPCYTLTVPKLTCVIVHAFIQVNNHTQHAHTKSNEGSLS